VKVYQDIKSVRLVDVAIVAASVLAAAGFWTRNLLLIALIIPAGIILVKHKASSQKERDRREALSLYSLAVSLLVPIVIIFSLIVYFILKIIPVIVDNWQG
jgi:4-hydroxybenzoate polyprenyltransferase